MYRRESIRMKALISSQLSFLDQCRLVLSAVKQHILDQVHIEQRKNLRIVPYPSDERYGIQAADSDTLRKVEVDHPEENEDISHYYKHDIVSTDFG